MTDRPTRLRWPVVLLGSVSLLAAGAGAAYVFMNRTSSAPGGSAALQSNAATATSNPAATPAPGEPLPDVGLTLTAESMRGAGIVVGAVSTGTVSSRVIVSGTVEPNTGQQVAVNSPAAGRVTSVSAEPGAQVERGQLLAEISSPDLAVAQTRFLSTQASATVAEQQLQRIEKLTGIGAVSRQDLERARADAAATTTELEAARAHLTLLGLSPEALAVLTAKGEVAAAVTVRAPAQGTVVQREVSAGQTVEMAARLFTIGSLSSVWISGDLQEQDLPRVRLGSPAAVTAADQPDVSLSGTVNYIDPQVNAATHTTRVRVDVPNPRGELHLGMPAVLQIGDAGAAEAALVPRVAIQSVGDREVVYLANVGEPGRFIEREIRLGESAGDQVVVVSGVKPGDLIVVRGSLFLRAERERLGLRAAPK